MSEDLLLLESVKKHGKKWAIIAKHIVGRNENGVKNRFNSLMKRETRVLQSKSDNFLENIPKNSKEKLLVENMINDLKNSTHDNERENSFSESFRDFSEVSSRNENEKLTGRMILENGVKNDEKELFENMAGMFFPNSFEDFQKETFNKKVFSNEKPNFFDETSKKTSIFAQETPFFAKEIPNFTKETSKLTKETPNFIKETTNLAKETSQETPNFTKEITNFTNKIQSFPQEIHVFSNSAMQFSKNNDQMEEEKSLPDRPSSEESSPISNIKKILDCLNSSNESYHDSRSNKWAEPPVENKIKLLYPQEKTPRTYNVRKLDLKNLKEERSKGLKLQLALINHEKKEVFLCGEEGKFGKKERKMLFKLEGKRKNVNQGFKEKSPKNMFRKISYGKE